MNRIKWMAGLLAWIALGWGGGCSHTGPVSSSAAPPMILMIRSDPATNNGQIFYLLIRSVNEKQFLTENYQSVADLVFSDPPHPSVLGSHVILPGEAQEIKIDSPNQAPVAFYFLFTEPGDQWKRMLSPPFPSGYEIALDGNQVTVQEQKGMTRKLASSLWGNLGKILLLLKLLF